MKKLLVSLILVISLFTVVACGSGIVGRYEIDSVEITGLEDLEELFGEMDSEEFDFSIASIFNSESLTAILVETGAFVEFKADGKVDIGTTEGVQETFNYELKNGKVILKKNGLVVNPVESIFGSEMGDLDLEELGIELDFSITHSGNKVILELVATSEAIDIEIMEIPALDITFKLVFKKI